MFYTMECLHFILERGERREVKGKRGWGRERERERNLPINPKSQKLFFITGRSLSSSTTQSELGWRKDEKALGGYSHGQEREKSHCK
jgi:hypothetical protein